MKDYLGVGIVVVMAAGAAAAQEQTGAGYVMRDERAAQNAPAFAWDDISAMGSTISFSSPDDSTTSVAIPFSFSYFGQNFTSVFVSTNGNLQFGSTATASYSNVTIPTAGVPNNMIAVLWDDLHLGPAGSVKYATLGSAPDRRFVVSWNSITHYPSSSPHRFTFQCALYEGSSHIQIQYQSMADNGGTPFAAGQGATIGIENGAGSAGLLYLLNGAPAGNAIANSRVVRCAQFANAPAGLAQAGSYGAESQPVGFRDEDGNVILRADVSHSAGTGATVFLEVEVKSNDGTFDGTGILTGPQVSGAGGTSEASTVSLPDSMYKWRCRANDPYGNASAWVEFNAPPEVDFLVGPGRDNENGDQSVHKSCSKGVSGTGSLAGLCAALAALGAMVLRRR